MNPPCNDNFQENFKAFILVVVFEQRSESDTVGSLRKSKRLPETKVENLLFRSVVSNSTKVTFLHGLMFCINCHSGIEVD